MFSRTRVASLVSGIARVAVFFGLLLLTAPGFSQSLPNSQRLSISLNGAPIVRSGASSSTVQLSAVLVPQDATNQGVQWSSNNLGVASVDSTGLVTAVGAGTAIITVRSLDGSFTDQCAVTVRSGGFFASSVATYIDHSLSIKADGSLWAWGTNTYGQLGLGDTVTRNTPTRVGADNDWLSVAVGTSCSFALKTDGSLWGWGIAASIGNGNISGNLLIPTRVGVENNWQAISSGGAFLLVLKTDGSLWAWGQNTFGACGPQNTGYQVYYPQRIDNSNDWSVFHGGNAASLALKSDGSLWSWGYGAYGTLGLGSSVTGTRIPVNRVGTDTDWKVLPVNGVSSVCLALKMDGSLWAWGQNGSGGLGLGNTTTTVFVPTRVGNESDWLVTFVGGGSFGIKTDGSLWAWGPGANGKLGLGDTADRNIPTRVGNETEWLAVFPGATHTFGMKTDGSLWAWGQGAGGRLGLGSDVADKMIPTRVY
jgi:alpha-tubulin suppressor-like RCC1 family protein